MDHERVTIAVHVHAGARRRGVGGEHSGALVVRVSARAVDGAANAEVLAVLAEAFGLRLGQVDFTRVTRSHDKLVVLEGDALALRARHRALLAARAEPRASQ